jgi:hypothetical protein
VVLARELRSSPPGRLREDEQVPAKAPPRRVVLVKPKRVHSRNEVQQLDFAAVIYLAVHHTDTVCYAGPKEHHRLTCRRLWKGLNRCNNPVVVRKGLSDCYESRSGACSGQTYTSSWTTC